MSNYVGVVTVRFATMFWYSTRCSSYSLLPSMLVRKILCHVNLKSAVYVAETCIEHPAGMYMFIAAI